MSHAPLHDHSWLCPQCKRQVPARINTCRCGLDRPTTSTVPAALARTRQTPLPATLASRRVRIVLAAGSLGLLLLAWTLLSPPKEQSSRPVAAVAPVAGEPHQSGLTPTAAPTPAVPMPGPSRALPTSGESTSVTADEEGDPAAIFAQVSPRIVVVEAITATEGRQGSGVLVLPETVVTNKHVVEGASEVSVTRLGRKHPVIERREHPTQDLAILRVPGLEGSTEVRLVGDLRVGERVYALGAPQGFELTFSEGLISSLRSHEGGLLIQTTAAVSHGSSGGGLFDKQGRLVGFTTFAYLKGQNLNFALPVDWLSDLGVLEQSHAPLIAAAVAERPAMPSDVVSEAPPTPDDSYRTPMDEMRDWVAENLEPRFARASVAADKLDSDWRRYLDACYEKYTVTSTSGINSGAGYGVSGGYVAGRDWFAVYENESAVAWREAWAASSSQSNEETAPCRLLWSDIKSLSSAIRTEIQTLEDAARRRGIYPGIMREVREKYRLEWNGWDR